MNDLAGDRGPIHLQPTAPLARRALLPGDPGRALALAQLLLIEPLMFNHHRGLWGYTGRARLDGELLTIQSTGMGGPSAAIVFSELVGLGLLCAIRVGTCEALVPELSVGELVVVREAIGADGASQALGAGERLLADQSLTVALERNAPAAHVGTVLSTDLFYAPRAGGRAPAAAPLRRSPPDRVRDHGSALAVEMQTAALFALGAQLGVPVGCALVVVDALSKDAAASAVRHERIDHDSLREAVERMGAAAVGALAERPPLSQPAA